MSFLFTAPALAQPAAPPDGAEPSADEIVVTTGFRERSLSETVGSTYVIDAAMIEARGASHLESVLGTAGNVTMTSGASRGRFVQMRGIGDLEQFVEPKHYPSIGLSIDGIDFGGIANAAMLFDVEQVEVLRGPQGTRFGASALAGQVYVRSRPPTESFDAYLDAGVADYGTRMLGFAVGGPLAERLTGRLAVQEHRGDGYIENAYLGRDDTNGYEESTLRAKLRFAPTDSAVLDLTAINFDSDNGYDAFSLDNTRTTLSDQPGSDDLALSALGLRGTWQLESDGTIEASLSWLDSEVDYGFDEDWTYVGICDGTLCDPVLDFFSNTDRYRRARSDTSLDLRWLGQGRSASGRERSYVLGVYAEDREETLARQYYGPFASAYAADRAALYGQIETGLSERLSLTLGYRYERFDDSYGDSNAFASRSEDDLRSGEIALHYALSDASTVYALVARGNKPGGVNTEASSVYPFVQPRFQSFLDSRLVVGRERLTNVELGVKTALLDRRLGLRAAVFRMSRDEAQLESWFWDPVNFLWVGLLDTAGGDNLGAEIDLDVAVTDRWRLRASVGLLDTEVDRLTTFDLDLDDFVDKSGVDQAKSPSWQAYVGSEWRIAADWSLAVDVDARDSHRFGYYHDATIGRATLVNAALRRTFGATELTLFARNLFDEKAAVHGLYFGNDPRKGWINERYVQLGEPRLVGLTVRRSF
jgi:outer membrane receptor protein involved in Fe transport